MSHRPGRALLLTALSALAAGGLLAGLRVLDVVHAALLVVVVAAVAYVWRTLDEPEDAGWPPVPEARRAGARNDVSELGWATFTRSGAVGNRMRGRVVALATARLAEHGVDLWADSAPGSQGSQGSQGSNGPVGARDRAAAAQLLGADVVAGMTSHAEATRAQVEHWLDAVERLAPPTHDPDGRHTA